MNREKSYVKEILRPQEGVGVEYTSTGQSKMMWGERAVASHERPFGWLLAYEFFRFVR